MTLPVLLQGLGLGPSSTSDFVTVGVRTFIVGCQCLWIPYFRMYNGWMIRNSQFVHLWMDDDTCSLFPRRLQTICTEVTSNLCLFLVFHDFMFSNNLIFFLLYMTLWADYKV